MAKLGAVQEQTMEEILASIRRMISEGDAAISETQAAEPRIVEPSRPAANVARLFEDEGDEPEVEAAAEVEGEMEDDTGAEDQVTDNVVALAIAQAMDDAEAELRADAAAAAMQPSEEEPSSPPAARDPLDLLAHQPLDQRWEIDVEPVPQHRPQQVLDQVVHRASTAGEEHRRCELVEGATHHRVRAWR